MRVRAIALSTLYHLYMFVIEKYWPILCLRCIVHRFSIRNKTQIASNTCCQMLRFLFVLIFIARSYRGISLSEQSIFCLWCIFFLPSACFHSLIGWMGLLLQIQFLFVFKGYNFKPKLLADQRERIKMCKVGNIFIHFATFVLSAFQGMIIVVYIR